LVEWKMASGVSEVGGLESWRKGVGPPLIMSPRDGVEELKRLDDLVIVSWNTHVGGADLNRFIQDLRDGRLTGGEPIHDFVLLLQEVFRKGGSVPPFVSTDVQVGRHIRSTPPSGERSDIVQTARRQRIALYYVPCMRNGGPKDTDTPEDRGNAILSTIPLSSYTAVELPYERERRLAIGASLSGETTTGTPWAIRVITVHLENRARWDKVFRSFGSARLSQVKAFAKGLSGTKPTVLGGDFNTWFREWNEPAIRHVEQFFHRPVKGSSRGTVRHGRFLPERMVDYLFFRLPEGWSGAYGRVDDRYGSDHYPLLGRVRIGDYRDVNPSEFLPLQSH